MIVLSCPCKEKFTLFSLPNLSRGRPVIPHLVVKFLPDLVLLFKKFPQLDLQCKDSLKHIVL